MRTILSPVHNHDLLTVRGTYGFVPELPARAGTEAVGVVEAIGEGVDAVALGQRVVTGSTFGVWAESFTAPAAALLPVPDGLPDEAAAQLVAMPFSAVSLLHSLELVAGDWLVQNAANGAVGRMLAQLATARGVRVVGLVRRAAGVDELADSGIEDVVATDDDAWRDRVRALTGGAAIRAGVDSVGGRSAGEVLSLLGDDGTLVVFGAMASPTLELASADVIFHGLTVKGFWGSRVMKTMDAATRGSLFAELQQRLAEGRLTLPVSGVYGLDDIADAVQASREPGRVGKVLLRP